MNRHALEVLEFPRVLERVASRASSPMGREAVLALSPSVDAHDVRRELARVSETMRFMADREEWAPPAIPDARAGLRRLGIEGSVLEGRELAALGTLLASARLLREGFGREGKSYLLLSGLRDRLHVDRERETAVQRAVDPDGHVLDDASRALRGIRGKIRQVNGRIVEQLEAYLRTLSDRIVVADASVTIRNGRYVIPIRREGRREVGGVVHGESGTGATLFIEPPLAIRLANDLQELEREEAQEVHRILRDFTDGFHPLVDLLAGSQAALVDFDSLYARARTARSWRGLAPEVLPVGSGEIVIAQGRHPLLLEQESFRVVPFDLVLESGERALVVSGPNTGGKSVFLKAIGLISALAQSGIVPPVETGTRLPVFTGIFADIGDEQSIAESLSTFSAHLTNAKEIVEGAGPGSLVLMDEMGTGTDPTEGAALARAILEFLVERQALSVVTSHLGALKRLDRLGSGIVNASLQFDPDRLEPTYLLQKGRPGRSYGLAIARRLGFPAAVLDRAETHMPRDEVSVEELLGKLERKEKELETLVRTMESERDEAVRLRAELDAREGDLAERERTAERKSREEAAQRLLDAREEVERAIREVRNSGDDDVEGSLDERERRARQRVERAVREQRQGTGGRSGGSGSPGTRGKAAAAGADAPHVTDGLVREGDRVRVLGSGARGTVLEVRDDRVTVEASGLRMRLSLDDITPVEGGSPGEKADREEKSRSRASRGSRASSGASASGVGRAPNGGRASAGSRASSGSPVETEVTLEADLRGLRVDELDHALHRALDNAIVGGMPELRIIHGKGTGALRARVKELLREDSRIRDFRPGGAGEGGAGVTVVDLT